MSSVDLGRRGWELGALRALQMASGLIGQLLLLARWSPHPQTDAFLILSNVPWLLIALSLVGGLDMALPAAYHRARRATCGGEPSHRDFMAQVVALSLLAAVAAAVMGGAGVTLGGVRLGLAWRSRVAMGALLGAAVLPSVIIILGRGVLIARDRLVEAQWVLVAQSALTALGYGLFPTGSLSHEPATALALTTLGAAMGAMLVILLLLRDRRPARWRSVVTLAPLRHPLHPEIPRLLAALFSLGAAAGLLHLQGLIERGAILSLGAGEVAAFVTASKGWDVALAFVVAAGVMPVYAGWARCDDRSEALLCWAKTRTLTLTAITTIIGGAVALGAGYAFTNVAVQSWPKGARAAAMALALLPRFVLLGALQPLIFNHYARGTPWYPVLGSALGALVLAASAFVLIPRWGLPGVAVTTAASVIPGWVVLGLHARQS